MENHTYDAWGQPLTTTGTLATTLGQDNPFRYRGYYYDTETGLYYLKSRYYDPDTCRFLNGDVLMSTGQGVIGYNMYGYCGNCPVVLADESGTVSYNMMATDGGGKGFGRKKLIPKPGYTPTVTPRPAAISNFKQKKYDQAGSTPIPNINHEVATSDVSYRLANSFELELSGGFGLGGSAGVAGLGMSLLARSDVLVLSLNENGFDVGRRESIEAGGSWFVTSSTYYRQDYQSFLTGDTTSGPGVSNVIPIIDIGGYLILGGNLSIVFNPNTFFGNS